MRKKTFMAAIITISTLLNLIFGIELIELAGANPYNPSTGKFLHPTWYDYRVYSPANRTYYDNNVLFSVVEKTIISSYREYVTYPFNSYRFYYILDGKDSEKVDQARVDLIPTKITAVPVSDSPVYEPYTDITLEFNVMLNNLTEGSHNIIWGIASSPKDTYWVNPYISKLNRDVYFTVDAYPDVFFQSPTREIYQTSQVSLIFSVYEPCTQFKYSLDHQDTVQIAGNCTLNNLQNGEHVITVYAEVNRYNNTLHYIEGLGYFGGNQTQWLAGQACFTVDDHEPSPISSLTQVSILTPSSISTPSIPLSAYPTSSQHVTPESSTIQDNNQNTDFAPAIILCAIVVVATASGVLIRFRRRRK